MSLDPVVVSMAEYQRVRRPADPPTSEDLALAEWLKGSSGPRLDVSWLHDGDVEIKAGPWVGSVRFSSFEVQVVPKLVGGGLRLLRMLEYAAGVNLLRRLSVERDLPSLGDDLFDLVCHILAAEARWLLRDGLLRDYRVEDATLEVLRGRLRPRDQYLRRFGRLDRLECTYDEYDSDTPVNQLVAAGLTVARRRASDPALQTDLTRLATTFEEACRPPSIRADHYVKRIVYDRRNDRYRPAHVIASLILEADAFHDIYERSQGRLGAFMLDMNVVFEAFVSCLVEEALHGTRYGVDRQVRLSAVIVNDLTGRTYSQLRPDLVVRDQSTGRATPIDVKYKLYEDEKISPSDIYQTFTYAYALGGKDGHRRAGILYPAADGSSRHRISVRPQQGASATLIGESLDVPALLDQLGGSSKAEALDAVRSSILSIVEPMAPSSVLAVG